MDNIVPGTACTIAPNIVRITAPNPGMMTGPGTNSYIVGERELALIDPGPDIDSHIAKLIDAVGNRLKLILCTHTHKDHSPAAAAVKKATGAKIVGALCPQDGRQDECFVPDRVIGDGHVVAVEGATFRAVHTPGHVSNHLCYLFVEQNLLFTGDHIMQGSTVVISPPDGDMSAYLASLEQLLDEPLEWLAPGHGFLVARPHEAIRKLVRHRLHREAKVKAALAKWGPIGIEALVAKVYDDVPPQMHPVAQRSLRAHLLKLASDGWAIEREGQWSPVD